MTLKTVTSAIELYFLLSSILTFSPPNNTVHAAAFVGTTNRPAVVSLARWHPHQRHQLISEIGHGRGVPQWMQSVPVNEKSVEVTRTYNDALEKNQQDIETTETFSISTRTFRPMSLSSRQAAPILVLHGGPSVPSNYLYPLVDVVPYRSIVYYDQLGCGNSSEPQNVNAYSISAAVDDLEVVIKKIGLRRFHIYGQSFGGILAFEYLKRVAERKDDTPFGEGCLSVILSSAPTSVSVVEASANRLVGILQDQDDNEGTLGDRFRTTHQCRIEEMPSPLVDAYARAGTVWRGTAALQGYEAQPPLEGAARMPSAMILRGEYDFVDHECVEDWKNKCFNHKSVREKVMEGCSHHGLLGKFYNMYDFESSQTRTIAYSIIFPRVNFFI